MKFVYPVADLSIDIEEYVINTVIIENPKLFYSLSEDLYNQINGSDGVAVLSSNNVPIQMSKKAVIITQFIPFTINQKELTNKLYAILKKTALSDEKYLFTNSILSDIEKYLFNIFGDFNSEFELKPNMDITSILKMFDVKFSEENLSLSEKVLNYMLNMTEYTGKDFFITLNIRSYISTDEIKLLYETLIGHNIKLLAIEQKEHILLDCEKRVIIDNDMCVI